MTSAWPNLLDLLLPADREAPVGLVGAPLGAGSVTPGRCDLAPAALRQILKRIGRFDLDKGHELSSAIADHGDAAIAGLDIEEATGPIQSAIRGAVERHALTLLIGGNNAVTRPGLLGMAEGLGLSLQRVGLITLDAHFDMRGLENGLSNGNPVRALIEDGLPGPNIVQIGLAPWANSRDMFEFADAQGASTISLTNFCGMGAEWHVNYAFECLSHVDAILLDCDIDVLDRSQFPAAPGGRADGMNVHDFYTAVRAFAASPKVRVIDLTEWDPPLDPTDLSALTAGRWVAEVLAGFENRL
nr:arginase family protein [uncultured Sphingomonas sp.]